MERVITRDDLPFLEILPVDKRDELYDLIPALIESPVLDILMREDYPEVNDAYRSWRSSLISSSSGSPLSPRSSKPAIPPKIRKTVEHKEDRTIIEVHQQLEQLNIQQPNSNQQPLLSSASISNGDQCDDSVYQHEDTDEDDDEDNETGSYNLDQSTSRQRSRTLSITNIRRHITVAVLGEDEDQKRDFIHCLSSLNQKRKSIEEYESTEKCTSFDIPFIAGQSCTLTLIDTPAVTLISAPTFLKEFSKYVIDHDVHAVICLVSHKPSISYLSFLETSLARIYEKLTENIVFVRICEDRSEVPSWESINAMATAVRMKSSSFDIQREAIIISPTTSEPEEALRLLSIISLLPAHTVKKNFALVTTRNRLLSVLRTMADVLYNSAANTYLIDEHCKWMEKRKRDFPEVPRDLTKQRVEMRVEELVEPQMICISEECVSHSMKTALATIRPMYSICHNPCKLTDVNITNFPNNKLRICWAFDNGNSRKCRHCKCLFSSHMQIFYKIRTKNVETWFAKEPDDPALIQPRDFTLEKLVSREQSEIKRIEREQDAMIQVCSEFSLFLKTTAKKNLSGKTEEQDWFDQYLDYLIRCTYRGMKKNFNAGIRSRLNDMRKMHAKRIDQLEEELEESQLKSVREINEYLDSQLPRFHRCSSILAEIDRIAKRYKNANIDKNTNKESF